MSQALDHISSAERQIWVIPDVPSATPLPPIQKLAVVGAGTMGGGIAMSLINAGIAVDIVDVDSTALERGLARIRGNYAGSVSRGRLSGEEVEHRMQFLHPTVDIGQAHDADIIIEAVFER